MIISKAASFPCPAQKGKNNCRSQGLKGPISPSPGGSETFPGSTSPITGGARPAAGSSRLLVTPSQGEGQEPGGAQLPRTAGRAGPVSCTVPGPATAVPCPTGDSQAEAQWQHQGHSAHRCIPLAKDVWVHEGGWSVHTQLIQKKWVLFLP